MPRNFFFAKGALHSSSMSWGRLPRNHNSSCWLHLGKMGTSDPRRVGANCLDSAPAALSSTLGGANPTSLTPKNKWGWSSRSYLRGKGRGGRGGRGRREEREKREENKERTRREQGENKEKTRRAQGEHKEKTVRKQENNEKRKQGENNEKTRRKQRKR